VDSDPNTAWSTAHYYEDNLKKAGGTGVGLYLDAAPGVAVRQIELQTPTPGFGVQIYAADNFNASLPYGDATPLSARGWQGPLGADASVRSRERIPAGSAGHRFRYYLIWLTKLPPGRELASISEVTLFR
jgi:eukaryotic-like serine/threonine-protein kinase